MEELDRLERQVHDANRKRLAARADGVDPEVRARAEEAYQVIKKKWMEY